METKLKNLELSPEGFVRIYLEENHIAYNYKTDSYSVDGTSLDLETLHSQLKLSAFQYGQLHIKPLLRDALMILKRKHAVEFLASLKRDFKFQEPESDIAAQWVAAVTGKADACDVAVLKHFIWQVRRKIFGLPVDWHMMPVLYGKSGGGKSIAVHLLLKPLETVTLCKDFTVFNDQFGRRQFIRNFVMFFDEMARSQDADQNCLKNLITSPVVDYRQMHSEAVQSGRQNCTFIACTNNPLSEQIQDSTSSRRFYQVNCLDRLDWVAINSLDYEKLWKSVNENAESPLMVVLKAVKTHQESQRHKCSVEEWLECFSQNGLMDKVKASVIYDSYREFMSGQCRQRETLSVTAFGRRLTELRIEKIRCADGFYYRMPSNQDVKAAA